MCCKNCTAEGTWREANKLRTESDLKLRLLALSSTAKLMTSIKMSKSLLQGH